MVPLCRTLAGPVAAGPIVMMMSPAKRSCSFGHGNVHHSESYFRLRIFHHHFLLDSRASEPEDSG
jgi:hypothetical protein